VALVSVIEAAGLSGLPPEAIRRLIRGGRLRAVAVPLGARSDYLLESSQLEPLAGPSGRDLSPLVDALAGLRAAIGRRRLEAEARLEAEDEEPGRAPGAPTRARPRRGVSGLGETELRALAGRVERLLGA
jgi:hypothetical protein